MKAHLFYLKYVLRHKWYVFRAGIKLGVPLSILLLHDWDKFLPDEWFPYVHTFYAPDGTKQYKESSDFAHAWMLHQHRNKHHWQYWLTVCIPSHNTAIPLPETNYLVWDRGNAQRIVKRNSGSSEWYELQDPVPSDYVIADPRTPMPDVFRREMLADWMGAGKALGKPKVWEWYEKNKDKMKLNSDTRVWIETEIAKLQDEYRLDQKGQAMGFAGASWFDE
jgi:uncharacterized protein DUF5662